MSKFTPGPWLVSNMTVRAAPGAIVSGVWSGIGPVDATQQKRAAMRAANARLIAAAPEMYELLDDAMASLESGEAETRAFVALQIRALLNKIDGDA